MNDTVSRRDALKTLAFCFGAAAAIRPGTPAQAEELPHLTETDPSAAALGYHENAKTVDVKSFPSYQSGQLCSNCLQLQGSDGQAWRPCNLFAGKLVNADGWCRVYTKKA